METENKKTETKKKIDKEVLKILKAEKEKALKNNEIVKK